MFDICTNSFPILHGSLIDDAWLSMGYMKIIRTQARYKWLCFIYYVSKSYNAKIFLCAIYMQKVG